MNKNIEQRGFTLIELLVVIAIIAVLAVVVILTLNPAQLLAQARDSSRISDMSTIKSAISLLLADAAAPAGNAIGASSTCYGSAILTPGGAGCGGRMTATLGTVTTTVAAATGIAGAGWMPINFGGISAGSPIGAEPVDPSNNATYFYSYATNAAPSYQFEINANMESTKYAGGGSDVEATDGGNNATVYETGTLLTL